ncbi:MAG: hypothetical protein M1830_006736 [Pleopsidium flavum]|nr:MAG: hypothetical protein M1830_006736 [Pleopsidium flavum]
MDIASTGEGRRSHDTDRNGVDEGIKDEARGSSHPQTVANGIINIADGDNKFQKAIAAWRSIDLNNLVHHLDSTASDIVSHQRDSLVQRKDLAQKTKEFRKFDDTGKVGEIKGLLKAYQAFIDLLTSHGKTTSSAFLQLYSSVSEAPDPYPLLEASVDSLLVSEDTIPKLTSENQHLQKTVAKLTIQLEATEKQLERERDTRKELEEKREAKVKEVEASWTAVVEEKQENWEAKERNLEEKVENQERLLREIKASYEVSQRLGRAEDVDSSDSRTSASAAELEIVSSDLERTSLRLAEMETRNEQLRVENAQSASLLQPARPAEDDPVFLRLQSENSSLLRRFESTKFERESREREFESNIRNLERAIAKLSNDNEALRNKTQNWGDYEEMKRELEVLKSIEFATGDEDDFGEGVNHDPPQESAYSQANGTTTVGQKETLEQLLLARNKKLTDELTLLRVSHQNLQHRLETFQEEFSRTHAELERSQNLTATLENDLLKVQQEASYPSLSSPMSVAGTHTSRFPQTSTGYGASSFGGRRGRASPTSSIISGFDPQNNSHSTLEAIRAGEAVGGGSGILPMVQAQRDRFKQKNSQLEEELSKTHSTVSSLRQEVASLQKDNLNLYEKSRYVSTYNRGHPSSSALAYSNQPNPATIQVSSDTPSGLSLDRYRSAYEANISPFAAFRGRESTRAYKRMRLPERIVFSITRMVLANRMSRNVFAAYCFALHMLVFLMLYWMGTVDMAKHASNVGGVAGSAAAVGGSIGLNAGAGAHQGDWQQEGFTGGG